MRNKMLKISLSLIFLISISFIIWNLKLLDYFHSDAVIQDLKERLRDTATSVQYDKLDGKRNHDGMRIFKILVWYMYQNFTLRKQRAPSKYWTVDNCLITTDRDQLHNSQAVVIPMQMYKKYDDLPKTRSPLQRWVMLFDDFPAMVLQKEGWSSGRFMNVFNWSMTYLSESDIPIPYGWIEKRENPIRMNQNFADVHRHDSVLVAAVVSRCSLMNNRLAYIKELRKHVSLDFYGKCGDKKCSGQRFVTPCSKIKEHKFFLAFENSNCKEYITEKLWKLGYENNVIPIVMGPPKSEYTAVAPPYSFIHVGDFESPKALAEYILMLDQNDTAYNEYFKWRRFYTIHTRQQFLGKSPWKLLCDKLNSVDDTEHETYDDIAKWYNKEEMCPASRQTYKNIT